MMTETPRERAVRNAVNKDFCINCNATNTPLQKYDFFDAYYCADGYGCSGEFVATRKQAATSCMMIAAIAAVVSIPFVIPALIWWLYL